MGQQSPVCAGSPARAVVSSWTTISFPPDRASPAQRCLQRKTLLWRNQYRFYRRRNRQTLAKLLNRKSFFQMCNQKSRSARTELTSLASFSVGGLGEDESVGEWKTLAL